MKNILHTVLFTMALFLLASCGKESLSSSSSQSSTSGSLARFTIVGNYLYTISYQTLKTYDITAPASPVLKSESTVAPNIETIYPFKDKLFIGSSQAMFIYNLTDPAKPQPISQASYIIRGTDPVVANDTMAFSTVRNLNGFGGTMNIIDIRQITSPLRLSTLGMDEPYGLGLSRDVLYVCEGSKGLKIFATNNLLRQGNAALLKTLQTGDTFYDVIPQEQILFAFIKAGFMTFDIADAKNPVQLARITN